MSPEPAGRVAVESPPQVASAAMRVVTIKPPWAMYLTLVPLLVGIPFAAADAWTPALVLFAIGGAAYLAGMVLFGRRVAKLREVEQLTSRDRVEIEYPRWARRGAASYLTLLAATTGILIIGAVLFVIVEVAWR
jgi:hypothetical protein